MAVKKKKPKKSVKKLTRKKVAPRKKTLKKRTEVSRAKKVAPAAKKAGKGVVCGIVTHYFPKVSAAVVKLKAPLSVGDTVKIKGHTSDFTQSISSIQIDHVPINSAKKGQEIGLLVSSRVRQHDVVYKV